MTTPGARDTRYRGPVQRAAGLDLRARPSTVARGVPGGALLSAPATTCAAPTSPSTPSTPTSCRGPTPWPARCPCTPPCAWPAGLPRDPVAPPRRRAVSLRAVRGPRRGRGMRPASPTSPSPASTSPDLVAWVDSLAAGRRVGERRTTAARTGAVTVVELGRGRFGLPARHLLPGLDRYARLALGGERRLAGYVEASHGCAHRCRHCPVPVVYDGRTRLVGEDAVVADVAQLVDLGARHITFGDPDFLNGPHHAVRGRRRRPRGLSRPDLRRDRQGRAHPAPPRPVAGVAAAGCLFVVSAFESASDHILEQLDKGHTVAEEVEAVAVLRDAGIEPRPSLLPFTPWTTADDVFALLGPRGASATSWATSTRSSTPSGSSSPPAPSFSARAASTGRSTTTTTSTWDGRGARPTPASTSSSAQLADIAEARRGRRVARPGVLRGRARRRGLPCSGQRADRRHGRPSPTDALRSPDPRRRAAPAHRGVVLLRRAQRCPDGRAVRSPSWPTRPSPWAESEHDGHGPSNDPGKHRQGEGPPRALARRPRRRPRMGELPRPRGGADLAVRRHLPREPLDLHLRQRLPGRAHRARPPSWSRDAAPTAPTSPAPRTPAGSRRPRPR